MKSKQRIAIIHYAAPPVVGGVESTLYHHARLLAREGYDVDIIAGRGKPFNPDITFHYIEEVDSRHEAVLDVTSQLSDGRLTPSFYDLRNRLADQLHTILKDMDVCIVHNAMTLHKNLPLTGALRSLADEGITRIIAWCHDFAFQDDLYAKDLHQGYPWDLLRTPWPDVRYVVVSAYQKKRLSALIHLPEDKIKIINPGIDIADFLKLELPTRHLMEQLNLLNADPLILLPARITRRKNIEFAVRVVAELSGKKDRAALLVTGPPGPHNPKNIAYLESLQRLRKELNVMDRVHFLYEIITIVTDNMIADLYQLSDLLLFPSRREGFGIPIIEAGMARLPVFAADIPPMNETGYGSAGFFNPDGNPAEIANAICAYFDTDQAYRFRKHVLSQYTWESILKNHLIPLVTEVAKK